MSLRVGVIGAGHIGNIHLQAYRECSDVEIVAVCDQDMPKATSRAGTFGATAYSSLEEMLGSADLGAVSVCTAGVENGSHHFEPVMQCLRAGVSTLCEKPLSNSIVEARAMVAEAQARGVAFGCDLNHRFSPQADRAQDWMADGSIGTPLLSNVTLWLGNPNDATPWFHLRALHPHSLDLMRLFCGRAVKVQAFFNRAPKADSPDGKRVCWSNAQINVLFENGSIGHLTGSYDANSLLNLERTEVMGTEGRFVIDNAYERATLYPRISNELTVVPNLLFAGLKTFDDTINRRIKRWVQQVIEGAAPNDIEASGADGLAVQEIIEAAIASWEGDCVVAVQNG